MSIQKCAEKQVLKRIRDTIPAVLKLLFAY